MIPDFEGKVTLADLAHPKRLFTLHSKLEFQLSLALFMENTRSRSREAETTRVVIGTGNSTEPSGANVAASLSDFLRRGIFPETFDNRFGTVDE